MCKLIGDKKKFKLLDSDPTIKREEKLIRLINKLKRENRISDSLHTKIRPTGSRPSRLYGLPKVHKKDYPFRPICSSIGSYNYNLASELSKIISPFATNEYTIRNTFTFVAQLQELRFDDCYLVSFDVSSLFTSIPLDQTIEITLDVLYKDRSQINGLSRPDFKKLLVNATKETHFIFNGVVYDQIDGVSMGSPLAPVLANMFMCYLEHQMFTNYVGTLPLLYRRYVDDSFLIFDNEKSVLPFFNYFNNLHKNIKFTKESQSEEINEFPFLDLKIIKDDNRFMTCTYHKPSHTGLYTNWYSFTPRKYKINLIKTLLSRAWNICTSYQLFDQDVKTIRKSLLENQYPEGIVDPVIKNFIDNKINSTLPPSQPRPEKKEMFLILPYHGQQQSSKLFMQLKKLLCHSFPQINLKLIFRTTFRISHMFPYKDKIPKRLQSHLVYGIHCTYCDSNYVGKTKRHIETRFKEHKNFKNPTAVTLHVMEKEHDITLDDMTIITYGSNDKELLIKESLVVKSRKPIMNNNVKSYPLELF